MHRQAELIRAGHVQEADRCRASAVIGRGALLVAVVLGLATELPHISRAMALPI